MSHDGRHTAKVGLQMNLGVQVDGVVYDRPLRPGDDSDEILTYLVDQVSFGVSVTDFIGSATFLLEGRIGTQWFRILESQVNSTGDNIVEATNFMLSYDKCRSICGIRCRFESYVGNTNPVAAVIAVAASHN